MALPPNRLAHVDGLRTIAILWVAIYHFAYFWTPSGVGDNLTPYGEALAWIPLARVGYLGVYLFFIVSGFVIALSLTRSDSIGRFAMLRAIRLWPTLLICGTITFIVTTAFGPAELVRTPAEYLVSLTFVPPPYIGRIIGTPDMAWLDGAYWSLWTEVRFYAIAVVLYFTMRGNFLLLWSIFALGCAVLHTLAMMQGGGFDALSRLLFAQHQPFFSAGISLAVLRHDATNTGARTLLAVAICQAFAYAWFGQGTIDIATTFGLIIVFGLAVPTMCATGPVPILSSRLLVTLGGSSYAYYLLHQNVGLSLLNRLAPEAIGLTIAVMIVVQIVLIVLSIALTQRLEAPLRASLRRITARAVA